MSARREVGLIAAQVQEVTASSGLTSFAELVPRELLNRLLVELGVVFREGVDTPAVTPEMIRKEIAMHLLAYNAVRRVMAEAARHHDLRPTAVSFTGAMQTLRAFHEQGLLDDTPSTDTVTTLLTAIAMHQVGKRPDRNELRANKRRPKYKFLTKPRHTLPNRVPHKT